jgi:L-galactonate 5-dehydrogenase
MPGKFIYQNFRILKMKAFAITEKKKIEAIEIAEPKAKANEIVIDIKYIGLCGSDLSTYRGLNSLVQFPRIPGHEIAGTILEKGTEVPDSFNVGARVTASPYTHCGVCPACRAGRFNTCEFNQTLGVQRDGALTKRIAVPYDKVFLSNLLSLEEMALAEPLSVGYHAANRAEVKEEDTVLVLGCGAIGIGAICASARKGARVVAADIDDKKLETARKLGAAFTINTLTEDAKSKIWELTQNEGVNVAIEAAGSEATQRLAIESAAFAGRIAMIGYAKAEVTLDTRLVVKKELNFLGSRNALRVFPNVIHMLERREKPYTDLITKVYDFDQVQQAFADWDADPNQFAKILIRI